MSAWHDLSPWGPKDSPGYPNLPNKQGWGWMNPARRLGSRGGWSWCVLKLLTNHICDNFCNPTSDIHNNYHVSNFPNDNQRPPNYIFIPIQYYRFLPYIMKYQYIMIWMGCKLELLYLMDPSKLGRTTHIIMHLWHVMKSTVFRHTMATDCSSKGNGSGVHT